MLILFPLFDICSPLCLPVLILSTLFPPILYFLLFFAKNNLFYLVSYLLLDCAPLEVRNYIVYTVFLFPAPDSSSSPP